MVAFIANRLGKLPRWIAELFHFWIAVLLIPITFFVTSLMTGTFESTIRLTGLALTLMGLATVAKGLRDTRKRFGLPSSLELVRAWVSRRRLFRQDKRIVTATGDLTLQDASVTARATVRRAPGTPLEDQVAALANNQDQIYESIARTEDKIDEERRAQRAAIGSESRGREAGDEKLRMCLQDAMTGGLSLERTGLLWLFVGAILSSASPELNASFGQPYVPLRLPVFKDGGGSYSYYAQVFGLLLNFIGAVLLLFYSPAALNFDGFSFTQNWERTESPEFKTFQRRYRIALLVFTAGFGLQFIGLAIPDNALPAFPRVQNLGPFFSEPLSRKAITITAGLVITCLLGRYVLRLVDSIKLKPRAPQGVDQTALEAALMIGKDDVETASRLGRFEQVLFFLSIYFEAYALAGGWLALKVASKWAAWQSIVKMPDSFPYEAENTRHNILEAYRVKNEWGSRLLNRFLLGTMYNLMCGLVGAGLAWFLRALLS